MYRLLGLPGLLIITLIEVFVIAIYGSVKEKTKLAVVGSVSCFFVAALEFMLNFIDLDYKILAVVCRLFDILRFAAFIVFMILIFKSARKNRQVQVMKCYRCGSQINVSQERCPICGAEQKQ